MSATFDPYHRWLGIRPEEQPADHYRLLGIARFEDDLEVIRDAAERQMAHVRRYALGAHRDLSQKILNELGAAKACLSDAEKRARYDDQLRGTASAPPAQDRPSRPEPGPPARHVVSSDLHLPPVSSARGDHAPGPLPRKSPSSGFAAQLERLLPPKLDALLGTVAGEGNLLVHNFLRCGVVLLPVALVLVLVLIVLSFRESPSALTSSAPSLASLPAGPVAVTKEPPHAVPSQREPAGEAQPEVPATPTPPSNAPTSPSGKQSAPSTSGDVEKSVPPTDASPSSDRPRPTTDTPNALPKSPSSEPMQANSATPATSSRSPAAPAPATKTPGAENVRPPPQPPEPPRFLAVWVKNQPRVDWLAAHDVNGADLQQMSAKNDHLGYMPVSISGYVGQADRYSFAAVWIKKPRTIEVVSNHSLEPAEFRRQEVSLARRRFRPLWLDVYGQGTEWRYATVWIRDNANIVWRVETFDDEPKKARQAVWDSLMASGHFPRVDSAYIDSRRVIHQTQLWHKESILHFVWFGDFTFYQAKLDEHKSGDAGPIYVDSYGDGPNVSFTQIGNASGGVEWTTTAARTGAEFQQAFDRLSKDGYRPTVINVR